MLQSWGRVLTKAGIELARTILPSWCVACGEALPWRDRVASCCGPCWRRLPQITGVKCSSCSLPLPGSDPLLCVACQIDPAPMDWCDSWGEYRGTLEPVLHAFKFSRHDFLASGLSSLIEETVRARGDLAFDSVVAVPMSPAKQRRRGYNQAELLGQALGSRLKIEVARSVLQKTVERETQSRLPREKRAANVRGVFQAAPAAEGRSVLLVDDICTTGQTLRAAARELLRAGAKRVAAVTVAKVAN